MRPCLVRSAIVPLVLAPFAAGAQLVTPKTVPVRQGEQFEIFPAARAGMAGVRLALDDTLADPFANPARATWVGAPVIFGAPFFHSLSRGGGGRTMPLGAAGARGHWGAAGAVAFQQLDRAGPTWNLPTSERTAINRYAAGALARRAGAWSFGGGAFAASLGAVDGVDQLYAGSDRIEQDGSLLDVRLGATRQWQDGRALDLVLVHNRTDVTHDVHYTTFTWNAATRTQDRAERGEHNVDRTHIWGAHGRFVQPFGVDGWRVGTQLTVNRLSHPKIPNYTVMNIPRDPGTTYAGDVGLGLARLVGRSSFGVDVVYEPMTSATWATAAHDTTGGAGRPIVRTGERTVDNRFRFGNTHLRLGVGRAAAPRDSGSSFGYELGLGLYAIDYVLRQTDHVRGTFRRQHEQWVEWTPTFALQWRRREFDLRYSFRVTCQGAGDCLPLPQGDDVTVAAPSTGGVIVAPSAPLRFDGGRASVHQFAIVVPIR
ncbi:hypothetical protein J421_1283 [Gemmatirosa kalamazoonensis]|uniref:Uncharacterized protein n=1 Tax=Gemmatirosa kalamazoonensis TaxID=861299 RepID=W0RER8_9BACT|nr:hypothetical protein [Gemmatirosa kalamazoonensis]AHG88820.1 hypothetical protein J421_1283 [Gemmatirosa kalamazoonensis]